MILFGNLVPAMADGIHTFTHSFIRSSIKNILGSYCVPGGLFGLAVTTVHKSHHILTFKELVTPQQDGNTQSPCFVGA